MPDAFDPYHRWLGIPPKHQPPDHYRLLGLERFEDDPEVIRDAAQQRIAHVRTYQPGKYAELSQRILNELAAAKTCLLDPGRKAAYDRQLSRGAGAGMGGPASVIGPITTTRPRRNRLAAPNPQTPPGGRPATPPPDRDEALSGVPKAELPPLPPPPPPPRQEPRPVAPLPNTQPGRSEDTAPQPIIPPSVFQPPDDALGARPAAPATLNAAPLPGAIRKRPSRLRSLFIAWQQHPDRLILTGSLAFALLVLIGLLAWVVTSGRPSSREVAKDSPPPNSQSAIEPPGDALSSVPSRASENRARAQPPSTDAGQDPVRTGKPTDKPNSPSSESGVSAKEPKAATEGTAVLEPGEAHLATYVDSDGGHYFALVFEPVVKPPAVGSHDIVVLVDTSASQTGDYRAKSLEVLGGLLSGLAAEDRVQLVAVDLNAVPLTAGFVAPGSPEMAAAVKKLDARVPLGSTDMGKALTVAADRFGGAATNPRAVVYIGDGMSTANLLAPKEFGQLIKRLTDSRISVTGYAIGPRLDLQLIGALASHTGGMMIEDRRRDDDAKADVALAVRDLVNAVRGPVLWPAKVTWPAAFSEVFPKQMPPLRSDRASIVIGTYKPNGPLAVQMTVDTADGPKQLTWDVKPATPSDDNNYLPLLVEVARADGGLSLPLLSTVTLKQAQALVDAGATNLTTLARQALSGGRAAEAARLAEAALVQDPQNPEAQAIKQSAAKQLAIGGGRPAADLDLVAPRGPTKSGDAGPAPDASAEELKRQSEMLHRVVSADVQNTIKQARKKMSTDPGGAILDLELQLGNVRGVPELDPSVRDQLTHQLRAALGEIDIVATLLKSQQQVEARLAAITANLRRHPELVDDTIGTCTESIRAQSGGFWALCVRAIAYSAKGETEKAIADYTEVIRLFPLLAEPYYRRGLLYQSMGVRAKAEADFAKASGLRKSR